MAKDWRKKHPEKAKATSESWRQKNMERVRANARAWYARNSMPRNRSHKARQYGISLSEYLRKVEAQQGQCAICGEIESLIRLGKTCELSVDHNHATGAVRDLLCSRCNTILGRANDNAELLLKMVAYLEQHNRVIHSIDEALEELRKLGL